MTGQRLREDQKGLIREAYRIEGIGAAECRSVFLDWALSLPPEIAPEEAIAILLAEYSPPEDHPMTEVLRAGLAAADRPRRRGGRGRGRG